MNNKRPFVACVSLIAALLLIIFLADKLCLSLVGGSEITLIKGVISLKHYVNTGAAFGILDGHSALASAAGALALFALAGFTLCGRMGIKARLSLCAVLTGGLCNLYMRLFYGGVNDWIALKFISFPAFNLADVCVCAGAALFACFYVFGGKGEKSDPNK